MNKLFLAIVILILSNILAWYQLNAQFKWTEKRPSFHKRYAYVSNHGTSAPTTIDGSSTTALITDGGVGAGDTYYFCMIGDYKTVIRKIFKIY